MSSRAAALVFLASALAARALGPHELLLLANRNDADSLELANHYAHLRRLPPANVVTLDLPPSVLAAQGEIAPADFLRLIYEPARREAEKRGLSDHILAWAYSAGFPIRVRTDPPISLAGATFVRGEFPPAAAISNGAFRSAFYRGPDRAGGPSLPARTFEQDAIQYGTNVPLPAMLLDWTGARGRPVAAAVAALKLATGSDGTAPDGTFWMVTGDDVRARTRAWQFADAQAELRGLGARAEVVPAPPASERGLLGLMMGAPDVQPERYGIFHPAAFADHLTSFAGMFHVDAQSKLTDWLRGGAGFSAGAVYEPFAIWTKFPSARLFAHYRRGSTALESLYQSVRSPLQLLPVGDPLLAPWARPAPVTLALLSEQTLQALSNTVEFLISAAGGADVLLLLDGRAVPVAGRGPIALDTRSWPDGAHELRAVAYTPGPVRAQSMARIAIGVRNRGRAVAARLEPEARQVDLDHPVRVHAAPEGDGCVELALVAHERVLAKIATNGAAVLSLDPRAIGAGPCLVQAVAVYADGMAVRSAPIPLDIRRLNRPPLLRAVRAHEEADGATVLTAEAADAEGDRIGIAWRQGPADADAAAVLSAPGDLVRIERTEEAWRLAAVTARMACAVVDLPPGAPPREMAVRIEVPDPRGGWSAAGLCFNVRDRDNFCFGALLGDYSAWCLGRVRDGRLERATDRGVPMRPGQWIDLRLRRRSNGAVELWADGTRLLEWPEADWQSGGCGLVAGAAPARFDRILLAPPYRAGLAETAGGLRVDGGTPFPEGLWVEATDGVAGDLRAVSDLLRTDGPAGPSAQ